MRISFCSKCGKRLNEVDLQGVEEGVDVPCRDCRQVPVASRSPSSDSKIKAVRRQSSLHIPVVRNDSGTVTAAGGPGGSSWPKEKHRRPVSEAPQASTVPIIACVTTVLAIVLVYALTRGKPEERTAESAPSPAPVRSNAVYPAPVSKPMPPPSTPVDLKKPELTSTDSPVAELKHEDPVEAPAPKDLTTEPVSVEPATKAKEAPELAVSEPKSSPIPLETGKVSSTVTDADEEEVLPTKTVESKNAPATPPKSPELAPLAPVAPIADAASRRADFEQKLRRGEWVTLFTREDLDQWEVAAGSNWKMNGEAASGNGRISYKNLAALFNYELTLDVAIAKGATMNLALRYDTDLVYRLVISDGSIEGQLYDLRQKKIKKTFEKVTLDGTAFNKVHVQSKGKWLRAVVNEKNVLIEYGEVPSDLKLSFYLWTSIKGKGSIKNVQFRPLF